MPICSETPVSDALPILENIPQVRQKLQTLVDVGLGYIQLGQSAVTLSGGEAQRIKLARELSKRQTGKTLYLLDEPTTGLHFDDVKKLLDVLHRLTDLGNTIVIIEHNLDVIRNADWVIDLGPEGGEEGGRIVAQGTPEQVARSKKSSRARLSRNISMATQNSSRKKIFPPPPRSGVLFFLMFGLSVGIRVNPWRSFPVLQLASFSCRF